MERLRELCNRVQPRFRVYGPIKCDGCKRSSANLYNCGANCCKPKQVVCDACSALPITQKIQLNRAVCASCWNYLLSLEDELATQHPSTFSDADVAVTEHAKAHEGKDEEEDDDNSEMDEDGRQCGRGSGNVQVCLQGIDGHIKCTPYVSVECITRRIGTGTGTTGTGLVNIIKAKGVFDKWVLRGAWRAQTVSHEGKALPRWKQLFQQGVSDGSRITIQIMLSK